VNRWTWILVIVVVGAGAGVGGYYLGRSDGVKSGVAIGKRQGAAAADRPLVMPLLLATEVTTETLLGALAWAPEELGEVDVANWTELVNRVPSPLQEHRKEGRTLAWSLENEADCGVCASQAGYARDLLAAGRERDEARKRLYQGVRFDFDTSTATVLGPADAPVQIVWWMDYQCPYCSDSYPVITGLRDRYPDQVQVAVMNLPLRIHPQADEAGVAAHAAGKQGKFLEISEVLFADRKKLSKQVVEDGVSMEKAAEQVGLDLERYRDDYVAAMDGDILEAQREQAKAAGVKSVPSFFVNGHKVRLPRTAEAYGTYVDRILAGENPALDP